MHVVDESLMNHHPAKKKLAIYWYARQGSSPLLCCHPTTRRLAALPPCRYDRCTVIPDMITVLKGAECIAELGPVTGTDTREDSNTNVCTIGGTQQGQDQGTDNGDTNRGVYCQRMHLGVFSCVFRHMFKTCADMPIANDALDC